MRYVLALAVAVFLACTARPPPAREARESETLTKERAESREPELPEDTDALTTLTVEQAKALAEHTDGLSMSGLIDLSDKAAAALLANPKISLPRRFTR